MNQNTSGVINQYKDIIRDQDYKIQNLKSTIKRHEDELNSMKNQLTELQQTNRQLYDQNILLKAQLGATSSSKSGAATVNPVSTSTEISFYQAENKRLVDEINSLNSKLNEALEMTEQSLHLSAVTKLRKDQEDLLELLTDQVKLDETCEYFFQLNIIFASSLQQNKIEKYKKRLIDMGQTVSDDDDEDEEDDEADNK